MSILSIDFGTYSIKFLESHLDRKTLVPHGAKEIVIQQFRKNLPPEHSLLEVQMEILNDYLSQRSSEGKIIMQYPSPLISMRFLTLPVTNKKKANLIIPFQLDKELPYTLTDIHYGTQLLFNKPAKNTYAVAAVTDVIPFENFYRQLEHKDLLPSILTCEGSVVQSFVQKYPREGSYCLVDIGHESTKAYFINNHRLVGRHISFTAGKHIDEAIAKEYGIPLEEAIEYKHQNGFFLTITQLEQVNEEQKQFAQLMEHTFTPLLRDLKWWCLGHKVNMGREISSILLWGGSSKMKNIEQFLSQELETTVERLPTPDLRRLERLKLTPESFISMQLVHMMGESFTQPLRPINFIHGRFASSVQEELPLHSSAFIGIRVGILALLLFFSLGIEKVLLSLEEMKLDKSITSKMKAKTLDLSRNDQIRYRNNPESVLNHVLARQKAVLQQIAAMKSTANINALIPLVQLNKDLTIPPEVELKTFKNIDGAIFAEFKSTVPQALEKFKAEIYKLNYPQLETIEDSVNSTLQLQYSLQKKAGPNT